MSCAVMRTRDPDPANAAFEHVAHAEFGADLLHVDGAALVGEGRVARDDEQMPVAGQAGDDVLDHAVGEEFLLGIGAHVLEGQNRDRGPVGNGQGRVGRGFSRSGVVLSTRTR